MEDIYGMKLNGKDILGMLGPDFLISKFFFFAGQPVSPLFGGTGRYFQPIFLRRVCPPYPVFDESKVEVPEGAPDCLVGLTFVISGTLDRTSFLSEEGLFDMIRASKPAKASLQEDKKPVNKAVTVASRSKVSSKSQVKGYTTSNWLKTWNEQFLDTVNKKQGKKQNDSGAKRAILLCGTPGIGKTTSAKLVCQELGFQAIEMAKKLMDVAKAEGLQVNEVIS
ncbi:hypothetical protein Fmac_027257 [Flemingia macrophylla]|uniref:ATPase AAA-type core domain-containing protein n=1 Tax=Flemingia macrophylla TaxID=520843 RepID=A0ABD1LHP7_9FABA